MLGLEWSFRRDIRRRRERRGQEEGRLLTEEEVELDVVVPPKCFGVAADVILSASRSRQLFAASFDPLFSELQGREFSLSTPLGAFVLLRII